MRGVTVVVATAKIKTGAALSGPLYYPWHSSRFTWPEFLRGSRNLIALAPASPLVVQPIGFCEEPLRLVTPVGAPVYRHHWPAC